MTSNSVRGEYCRMRALIFLALVLTSMAHLTSALPAYALAAEDDPVAFAISEIKRLDILWTQLFYASTESVYRFAAPIAMSGGGYVLLQSPKMVVDLVSGGLSGGPIGGLAKWVDGIQVDFVLYLIEASVKTPKSICRGLVKETIDEGWAEYKRAYEIAKAYKRTGSLTRDQALEFLRCRYGPDKLTMAKTLRERISTADYSIGQTVAEEITKDILSRFTNEYQARLGLGVKERLPLAEAAFFIRDIEEILRAKKTGLLSYVPYQRFSDDMGKISSNIMKEAEKYVASAAIKASRPSETTPEKSADPRPAVLALASDFFSVRTDETPSRVGPFRIGMTRRAIEATAASYRGTTKISEEWGEGGASWHEIEILDSAGRTMIFCLTERRDDHEGTIPMDARVLRMRVVDERFRTPAGLRKGLRIQDSLPLLTPAKYHLFEDSTAAIVLANDKKVRIECRPDIWGVENFDYNELLRLYPGGIPVQALPKQMSIRSLCIW